jgi:hypothetical protein
MRERRVRQSAVRCRPERQKVSEKRESGVGGRRTVRQMMGARAPTPDTRHPNQNVWSGPVSRILFPRRSEDEDHSSATRVAAVVKQPTRKLITETGGSMTSLFGLAPQGVCRAAPTRVGRGALLPHRFTLTSSSEHLAMFRGDRRSILCCTFRRVAAPGR